MMLISKKTWKLFMPILFMIIIILLAFYSKDLLKYGNRDKYPIDEIVDEIFFFIMGISILVILFIIDIFLSNYLMELEIIQIESEMEELKKKE